MKKPTSIGLNRTGVASSPIDSRRLARNTADSTTDPHADAAALAAERLTWSAGADPVGTMPPPASLRGAVKTGIEMVKGHKPTVVLDKLGERAAFERSGVRLYEALLVKHAAADVHEGGPTREALEHIRDDELRHYAICRDALIALGADPTVMTPCADVSAVMSLGLVQVLTDPRTTLTQCLEAILIAELADNDAWFLLAEMADDLGNEQLGSQFRVALREEEEHLSMVRGWISTAIRGQSGVAPTPPQPEATA